MSLQEPLHAPPGVVVVAADLVEVGSPLGRSQLEGGTENVIQFAFGSVHDFGSLIPVRESMRVFGRRGATKKINQRPRAEHRRLRRTARRGRRPSAAWQFGARNPGSGRPLPGTGLR